ncbi:uncharacterized protein (DUF488 family) [Arthrobacter pascens]|uniref:DUF488 domain-containing protein n=1 Tax=Arthrobacter pascens TaxID=1677 RepID=UPI00278EE792|nr:DUF488 domain-containing protein [Arthrobacter pascens]MDQ0677013.1 uncharacterized protein (DUF488 family) [Arthrobacter pascens]
MADVVVADRRVRLLTVGHGTAGEDEFGELLAGAGIQALVDVRIAPGSRKFPHFGKDQLEEWLPAAGVEYRWEKRLGGFRKPPPDSPDIALRNESFRAYAAYMRTSEFSLALGELIGQAVEQSVAIMCSETVWWRCHRRLISDHAVLLDRLEVRHLMPGGKLTPHQPTSGARVKGAELYYDVVPPLAGHELPQR